MNGSHEGEGEGRGRRIRVALVTALLPLLCLTAGCSRSVQSAEADKPGVGERVGKAVDETAAKAGKALKETGEKVAKGAETVGKKVGEAVGTAVEKTGEVLHKTGEKIEETARAHGVAKGADKDVEKPADKTAGK